jgi:hypothetical protein
MAGPSNEEPLEAVGAIQDDQGQHGDSDHAG